MEISELTVAIPVIDSRKSKEWYVNLLGKEPDLEPIPGMFEFKINGTFIQLIESEIVESENALRFGVKDINNARAHMEKLGIKMGEIEVYPDIIKMYDFSDPDGNKLTCYQLL